MTEYGSGMGGRFSALDVAERCSLHEQIRGAGFSGAICLLAWLLCSLQARGASRDIPFMKFGPTEESSDVAFDVLLVYEFVVASHSRPSIPRSAYGARGARWGSPDWTLNPSLGTWAAALEACKVVLPGIVRTESFLLEVISWWRTLAIAECSAFVAAELEDHHLDPRWAATAAPAIERIIERLPISQAFNICWLSVRDVASAYLKYPGSRDTLGSVLRGSLEQKLGRARAERWALRSFNRHTRCPESALARVFAIATELNVGYLHLVPCEHALAHLSRDPERDQSS